MRLSTLALAAIGLALAVPAAAGAQPNSYRLETTLVPGERAALRIGTLPQQGEFRFVLRASSDDEKRVTLMQRRIGGGTAFTVLDTAGETGEACEGAAGTLVCRNVSTPATPAGHTWRFVLRNGGPTDVLVTLTITFRRVPNAG
jgi:hypothetical protein